MVGEKTRCCANCFYSEMSMENYGKAEDELKVLECRRHAPRPCVCHKNTVAWPEVLEDQWCGEFYGLSEAMGLT